MILSLVVIANPKTIINKDEEFFKMFGFSSIDELPELPRYKLDENEQIVIDEVMEAPMPARDFEDIENKEDELQRNRMYSQYAEDGKYTKTRPGWEGYVEDTEKRIANLEYQKQKLYEEFDNRMYKDIMDAIDNLVENNNPRKTAAIKKALWELTNTDEFEKYRKTIDNDLYRRIKQNPTS